MHDSLPAWAPFPQGWNYGEMKRNTACLEQLCNWRNLIESWFNLKVFSDFPSSQIVTDGVSRGFLVFLQNSLDCHRTFAVDSLQISLFTHKIRSRRPTARPLVHCSRTPDHMFSITHTATVYIDREFDTTCSSLYMQYMQSSMPPSRSLPLLPLAL